VAAFGGKLHGYWYAFGDVDGFVLFEAPDDVAAAGLLARVASTGAFTSVSTTKLLTIEEALDGVQPERRPAIPRPGRAAVTPSAIRIGAVLRVRAGTPAG
jgi:hypothetical protein